VVHVVDPDQLRLMKQIHDEAELLRAVAHEADVEMAAIGAATRRKRELERLRRERQGARPSADSAGKLGETQS
jgi:hypothetical protein